MTRRACLGVLLSGWLAVSLPATAEARWVLTPTISLTEEFDDNLFDTTRDQVDDNLFNTARDPRSDFVTRVTPGLRLEYEAPVLSLGVSYSVGFEIFARFGELDNVGDNQQGGLTLQYRPSPSWTLGLGASFAQTESPGSLLFSSEPSTQPAPSVTGVSAGRQRTRTYAVNATAEHQLDQLTRARGAYGYARSETEAPVASEDSSHQLSLGVSRRLSSADDASLTYQGTVFLTDPGDEQETSHAALIGWTRQLGERTTVSLQAGPRISDGKVGAEVNASLSHRLRDGAATLSYLRTQQIVAGRGGVQDSDSVSLSVNYLILRDVTASGSLAFLRLDDQGSSRDEQVYSASAGLAWRLSEWITGRLTYRFSLEDQRAGEIRNHVVALTLELSYPIRLDD